MYWGNCWCRSRQNLSRSRETSDLGRTSTGIALASSWPAIVESIAVSLLGHRGSNRFSNWLRCRIPIPVQERNECLADVLLSRFHHRHATGLGPVDELFDDFGLQMNVYVHGAVGITITDRLTGRYLHAFGCGDHTQFG